MGQRRLCDLRTGKGRRRTNSGRHSRRFRLNLRSHFNWVDQGGGACFLSKKIIAELVRRTLLHFENTRYRLSAWCIMPNHVHVVFKALPGHTLSEIVHSWKSYTANTANRILARTSNFWQREYYDHLIRDQGELERAIFYVTRNPEKANLKDWPWVWVCGQDARTTAAEDGGATIMRADDQQGTRP